MARSYYVRGARLPSTHRVTHRNLDQRAAMLLTFMFKNCERRAQP